MYIRTLEEQALANSTFDITRDFSIKNGGGTCFYQLQTVLTQKPTNSFLKSIKLRMLVASRFSISQF